MSKRHVFPLLLSGLLAVGCATANAQEDEVEEIVSEEAEPAPAPAAQGVTDDHEGHREELRERVIVAEQELARRRAELDVARQHMEEAQADLARRRTDVHDHIAQLRAVLADVEAELDARKRRGLGDDHPEVVELQEQIEKHRRAHREAEEHLAVSRAEMEPLHRELRERELHVARAERSYREAVAWLNRQARRAPAAAPDRPFQRGGGGEHVGSRLDRLERAVEELHRLFERHGVPERRRELAYAEMERYRTGARGRRGRDGLPGRGGAFGGRGGAGGAPGQPGQPGGVGRFGFETAPEPTPPPDADAVRARMAEAHAHLERARAENEELRRHVEEMHRELQRARAEIEAVRAEAEQIRREAMKMREEAERARAEKERGHGEGEGGGAR
jgi:hypothetical protein